MALQLIVPAVTAMLLGLLPAAVAHRKGRSFARWWLYGAGLLIVALPHALLLRPRGVTSSTGNEPHPQARIVFRVRDEAAARALCDDQHFLYGALTSDPSPEARRFLAALRSGGSYRYEVRRASASGECEVTMWMR